MVFPPPSRELQLIKLASTSSGTAAPALSSAPSITTAAVCNIYRWAVGATPRTTPLHFTPLHPTPRSRSPGQRVSACPSPRLPSSPARVLDRDVQTGRGPPAPHAREVSDDERARPIEVELLLLAQSIARGGGRSLLVSGGGGSGYSGGKERGRAGGRPIGKGHKQIQASQDFCAQTLPAIHRPGPRAPSTRHLLAPSPCVVPLPLIPRPVRGDRSSVVYKAAEATYRLAVSPE